MLIIFLDVRGAIDGCHIPIKVPEGQQDSYLNRKFFHSINLQAICRSSKILTNVFIGFPGASNDAGVCYIDILYIYVIGYTQFIDKIFLNFLYLLRSSRIPKFIKK